MTQQQQLGNGAARCFHRKSNPSSCLKRRGGSYGLLLYRLHVCVLQKLLAKPGSDENGLDRPRRQVTFILVYR
eukprot:CAMPEP_0185783470 /NCGR_PEP_ID=MMETSP1174-20130828/117012_1 /TAXON_ID=35687 /ORGANISM="Dictyocha speculum, Strain CCMP1381" /LENGTH=72 /DNA_ID=CAMNT_0028474523 /DNA_START=112 /DNA_END=327 /DNA_ORIENTATION=+